MRKHRLTLERGEEMEETIFAARRSDLSRAALTRELAPRLARWIKAACLWSGTFAIGDHRFVIFSLRVAPDLDVFVQFWSEPREPVLWEVSSGRANSPAGAWLAGARAERIEAFGFEAGGPAGNFQREVDITSAADAARVARTVADIFYAAFDYRGTQPITARLVYGSRGEARIAHDAFTPEDLAKIFHACGFHAQVLDGEEDEPVLRAIHRGTTTMVNCLGRVPGKRLFRGISLTADLEPPWEHRTAARAAIEGATGVTVASLRMGTTLAFDGGVTIGWVVRRIEDWTETTWEARREARRHRTQPRGRVHGRTVH